MNPIIYFTDFLEIYDKELSFPITKKRIFKRYILPITIGKFTLLITSNIQEYLAVFSNYFYFDNKIKKYRNIVVVSLDNSENYEGIFEKNIQGIKKGFDEQENTLYQYLNSSAKIFQSNQYIQFSIHDEINKLMFFITKIIETNIINLHLKLGYLPVHAGLCTNKNNEYSLVLGNSQSGKTTYCMANQKRMISDEITFLSLYACLPFGHYYKQYTNNTTNTYIESFQSCKREIHKIKDNHFNEISLNDISEIVFLETVKGESRKIEILDIKEKNNFLLEKMLTLPNHAFLDNNSFSILVIPIINKLTNNSIFIKQRGI